MCANERIKKNKSRLPYLRTYNIINNNIIHTTMGRATTEHFYITARETSSAIPRLCGWGRSRRTSRRRRRCGRRVTVVARGRAVRRVHRRVPTTIATVCQCVRAIRTRSTGVVVSTFNTTLQSCAHSRSYI